MTLSPAPDSPRADGQPPPGPAPGGLRWDPQAFGGAWVLGRPAEVEAVLRDPRFSVARVAGWGRLAAPQAEVGPARPGRRTRADAPARRFQGLLARALLFLDGPAHRALRPALLAGFTPAALASLRPQVAARCAAALAALRATPGADFIAGLARPLPAAVIADWLGLPEALRPGLTRPAADLARLLDAMAPEPRRVARARAALLALAEALVPWLAARRAAPLPARPADGLDRLLAAEAAGLLPDADDALAQALMLLFAGHETTRHLLGSLVAALLAQPDALWARLREEPAARPAAVREVLRLWPPVRHTVRRVAQALDWDGQALRRGDLVVLDLAAAGRDPGRFDTPEAFRLDRPARASLAFGHGPHVCLGAALSLLEAELLLDALLDGPPPRLVAPPAWIESPLYVGLERLPLAWG